MNKFTDTGSLISNFEQLQDLLNASNKPLDETSQLALNELVSILKSPADTLNPAEISDIGELGYGLLHTLFFDTSSSDQQRALYNQISIAFAYWVASHGGTLKQIEHPVNSLAQLANTIHDKTRLEALYEVATYLVAATDEDIKKTVDTDEAQNKPGSPWHVLIMNYCIIATRSHNPDIMDSAFFSLLKYFPEIAPAFFKQGMAEMVRLNYPDHVRIVMQRYYDKYGMHTT